MGYKEDINKYTDVINGKLCVTTKVLCDLLGITQQSLSVWEKEGCPKQARGWWPLKDVLEWRGLVSNSGLKTPEDIEKKSLQEQKLYYEVLYKQVQYESTDLKNAVARRDYIPKDEIISELQRFFIILKRSMLAYSRKIANELSTFVGQAEARRIEKLINDLTIKVLEQLSINGIYEAKKTGKR